MLVLPPAQCRGASRSAKHETPNKPRLRTRAAAGTWRGFPSLQAGNIIEGMCKRGVEEEAWDLDQGGAILSPVSSRRGGLSGGDPSRQPSWRGCLPGSAVEMEGAPCTWLWREMPVCTRNASRGGKGCSWTVYPRGGRPLVGGGGILPGGDRAAGLARGWGRGWPASRGVWMARGLSGRQGGSGTPADVGRGLPSEAEAGGCHRLLLAGGQGPAWEPDSWAGEWGPRDAGAARLDPVPWAPHVWEPAETRLAGAQAAGSSSQGCRACGRRGWAAVPRAEWAERPRLGLLPGGGEQEEGGGRASAGTQLHLPQPRRRPEMGGERVRPGSSSSPSDPAPASARGGIEARPCCRFLREPRLGRGGRGGRLRRRPRPALAPPVPARTGERLAAAPAAPPRPGGGGGRRSGSRGKVTARQFPVHVSCAARSSR